MGKVIKKLCLALLLLNSVILTAHAENKPLRVAIAQLTSPFVMQGNNQVYGFDIAMLSYLCPLIHRDCQFQLMDFDKILPAVAANKVDIGVGGITITPERAKTVNFSIPYFSSETQFLGKKDFSKKPFTIQLLEKTTFGVQTGTIFAEEIKSLGLVNPSITNFEQEASLIEAVSDGTVDLALVDQSTAMYWQGHSGDQLIALDKPITYGFGFGVAVSPADPDLLTAINQAITQYKNSNEFKTNVLMYLNYF